MWTSPVYMNDYARWSGDIEGLVQAQDGWHAKCHAFDRFWLSPACRHNVSECIPMLSHEYGWLVDAFMAWSTAYGMPAAVGIMDGKYESTSESAEYFYSLARSLNVLSFWFRPDTSQVAFDPLPIIFPVHVATEWAVGNKRTAATGSYIGKLASRRLREQAYNVLSFLENLKLELTEMQQYLGMKDATKSWEDVACQWITSNRQRWERWVPKDTTCIPGFGLIDAAGNAVTTREAAKGCGLCTPGTSSKAILDETGRTYTCDLCSPGTYQEVSGETLCITCPAGRVAAEAGVSQCEACTPGSYANSSGLESCQPCGNGDDQSTWTTSRLTEIRGSQQWIQVEAAASADLCHCIPGWFLRNGRCHECTEGASCPGSSQVEVLPGYFSSSIDPGSIYRCYRSPLACPGGDPGTCAEGRDNRTVACSACMVGLHPTAEGCAPCQGQDYFMLIVVCILVLLATGGAHAFLLFTTAQKVQVGLVKVGIYIGQLAVCVQVVVVMHRMDMEWQEPFVSILRALSFISVDELMQSLNAVSCVTRFSPTVQFLFQTVAVPLAFMTGPAVVHLQYVCICKMGNRRGKRTKAKKEGARLHILAETFGMLCMLFFIVLCTAVLEPFDCVTHPNLASTMTTASDVLCNFRDDHWGLSLAASFLTLLPVSFVALCAWILLMELPKRIHRMDVKFIRSCSFLLSRFRPGHHAFAIFLLVRNAVVAMSPILPSVAAGCLAIFTMLCLNLCLSAVFQPWLFPLCTYMDMLANVCFLLILLHGAFYVEDEIGASGMIACSVVFGATLALFFGLAAYSLVEYWLRKQRKTYQFFLTHHKSTAGSVARLVKLELQQHGCSVFLDSDDLSSLVHLFGVISQSIENLIVIGSADIWTRKWCVGEVVTAKLHDVTMVVLALPGFHFPDAAFIAALDTVLGDLNELVTYGLSKSDIKDTLTRLRDQKTIALPERFQVSDLACLAEMMQQVNPARTGKDAVNLIHSFADGLGAVTSCLVLANHDDMEALATAHVLRIWMFPHLLQRRINGPFVISSDDRIMELGIEHAKLVIVVCTKDCLEAPGMVQWMIQCYHFASHCRMLPIIADEDFRVPGTVADFRALARSPNVLTQDESLPAYLAVVRVLFTQIAFRFSARYSNEATLKSKAGRFAERLLDLENLATLLHVAPLFDLSEVTTCVHECTNEAERNEVEQRDADRFDEDNEGMQEVVF
ncbi:Tg [Symbiodinium sp. CCMP2456]|nr:Tg [Symbiodinium sp. CCMP2456]